MKSPNDLKLQKNWRRYWLDSFQHLDITDFIPILSINSTVLYGLLYLGVFSTITFASMGVGLGAVILSTVLWQAFKYPIKRACANIVGAFLSETPSWGQFITVEDLMSSIFTQKLPKPEPVSVNKRVKKLEDDVRQLVHANDDLIKSNTKLREEIQAQELSHKVLFSSFEACRKEIGEMKHEYEQKIIALKFEYDKTISDLNLKLQKATEMNDVLQRKNTELMAEKEKILKRLASVESDMTIVKSARSRSPSPDSTEDDPSKKAGVRFFD